MGAKNYGRQREIIAVRTSFLAKLSLIREASASSISKTKKRNSNVFLERASQTKFVTCDSVQTTINQSGIECQTLPEAQRTQGIDSLT